MVAMIAVALSTCGERGLYYMRLVFYKYQGIPSEGGLNASYLGVTYVRMLFLLVAPLTFTYLLQDIVDIVYARLSKRRIQICHTEMVLDVAMIVTLALLSSEYNMALLKF